MSIYSIRITIDDDKEALFNKLKKYVVRTKAINYLFIIEVGGLTEKQHYQGAIETTMSENTLRTYFREDFPECTGNERYSIKSTYKPKYSKVRVKCDKNLYAYCAKEKKELETHDLTNFTKDEFKGYNLQYWDKYDSIKLMESNKRKHDENKKQNLIDSAVKFLCDGNFTLDKKPIFTINTNELIKDKLIQFYVKSNDLLFNESTFKWLFTMILRNHFKELYEEYIKYKLINLINI